MNALAGASLLAWVVCGVLAVADYQTWYRHRWIGREVSYWAIIAASFGVALAVTVLK